MSPPPGGVGAVHRRRTAAPSPAPPTPTGTSSTEDDQPMLGNVEDHDTIATRALATMPDHEIERQVARCERLISTHRAGMRDYVLYVHAKRELARRTAASSS